MEGDYDILGIDPGINGAYAVLRRGWNRHGRFAYTVLDMGELETMEDGENRQINAGWLGTVIEQYDPDHAVIENVQPMPSIPDKFTGQRRSMGAASSFRFGLACGMIRATVLAYQVPVTMVHPRSWTNYFQCGSDKKVQSAKMKELVPSSVPFITLVKHHGRANAGLLALYHAMKAGMV